MVCLYYGLMPFKRQVLRPTAERAEKLFGHSAFGYGALIREFLRRPEGAAMRLVCKKLCETVDGHWIFPEVPRWWWTRIDATAVSVGKVVAA
jgi:hypothetical protein